MAEQPDEAKRVTESLRVLHVYRTYFPDSQGGLEEAIRQTCLNTKPLGIESRVLSLSRSAHPRHVVRPECDVFRCKLTAEIASCGMSIEAFRQFGKLAEWADVINYHFPWPFADVLHFVVRPGKTFLVTYHSDIVRQRVLGAIYAPLMKRFLAAAARIVCTSPNYLATSRVLRRFEDKVDVIPIGLNEASVVTPSPESEASCEQTFGRDFFLFVGVLRYYKGLHILLDAMQAAPFNVVIVGSGPIEADLKRQARRLGLSNVRFAGHLPDESKMALFRLCRAVVFPSFMRSEAFGITLLEGAMAAKPLISTEVGSGTSHVNVDGQTGIVVPPGDPAALRRAMDVLWTQPDLARAMGAAARARYEQLFTGELMGQRYREVYRQLAQRSETCAGIDDPIAKRWQD